MVLIMLQVQILMVLPKQILILLENQESQLTQKMMILYGDDFNPDGAAIQIDLHKVGGVPGSSKHQPHPAAETLRRHQWMNDWHLSTADISFNQAHAHLKHSVYGMESEELTAHLKTTGILFKGVKSEISKITEKVDGIKDYVDSSIGRMITKAQAATIIGINKTSKSLSSSFKTKWKL